MCRLFHFFWLVALLTACASAPSSFTIQKNIAAKTDNADCAKLAKNMNESIAGINKAQATSTTAGVATGAGMALSVLPGGFLIAPLVSGAGIVGRTAGAYGGVEPQVLYEQSFQLYSQRNCEPKATFGEPITGSVNEGDVAESTFVADPKQGSCITNWSETGAFEKGQQFKTFGQFEKTKKASAFDKVMVKLSSSGYQIGTNSKESGLITAIQPLRTSAITINTMVQELSVESTRVEVVITVPSGYGVKSNDAKKEMCGILSAASEPPPES